MIRIARSILAVALTVAGSVMSRVLFSAITFTLLFGVGTAGAKLTTTACLAQKRKAWGELRKCQATDAVKQLTGKTFDPRKCQDKFGTALSKLDTKATKAAVACLYRDSGEGTVIDYDTGLEWEQKTGIIPGGGGFGLCLLGDPHCVNDLYTWFDAQIFVNGLSGSLALDDSGLVDVLAGHTDWRLPTAQEMNDLVFEEPDCSTAPCIDPIFGPTQSLDYWTSTSVKGSLSVAVGWFSVTDGGLVNKSTHSAYVRAVRIAF